MISKKKYLVELPSGAICGPIVSLLLQKRRKPGPTSVSKGGILASGYKLDLAVKVQEVHLEVRLCEGYYLP